MIEKLKYVSLCGPLTFVQQFIVSFGLIMTIILFIMGIHEAAVWTMFSVIIAAAFLHKYKIVDEKISMEL